MINYQKFFEAFIRGKESFDKTGLDDIDIHFRGGKERFYEVAGITNPEKRRLYEYQKTAEMNNRVEMALRIAKVYEVDDKIKRLLCLTNAPTDKRILNLLRLPFHSVFIEIAITQSDGEIGGVPAINGILITEANTGDPNDRAFIVHYSTEERTEKYRAVYIDEFKIVYGENIEIWYDDKVTAKFIRNFIINLILFIQNPEVEIREFKRSTKNQERRNRKGQLPLPDSKIIRLTGRIKRYIDSYGEQLGIHYNYRFWVHGFWRHYHSREHWRNLYALSNEEKTKRGLYEDLNGVLTQFIAPFQKGEGIEVPQSYKIVHERKDDRIKEIERDNLYYEDIKPLNKPLRQMKWEQISKTKPKGEQNETAKNVDAQDLHRFSENEGRARKGVTV